MRNTNPTSDSTSALIAHINDLMTGADIGFAWYIGITRQLFDDNVYIYEISAHISKPIQHPRLTAGAFPATRLAKVHGEDEVTALVALADLLADVIATGKRVAA